MREFKNEGRDISEIISGQSRENQTSKCFLISSSSTSKNFVSTTAAALNNTVVTRPHSAISSKTALNSDVEVRSAAQVRMSRGVLAKARMVCLSVSRREAERETSAIEGKYLLRRATLFTPIPGPEPRRTRVGGLVVIVG